MRGDGNSDAPIRHLPYAYSNGNGFGDHYVNRAPGRFPLLAEQVTVTIYPEGNKSLPTGGELAAFRYEPHVETRVFTGGRWETRGRTFIGK